MSEPLQRLEQFVDEDGRHWVPLAEATAEIERLREALRPFAEAAYLDDPDEDDSHHIAWVSKLTIGSLRRARAALEEKP